MDATAETPAIYPEDSVRDNLSQFLNYNFCGELAGLENVFDLRDGGYGYAMRISVPPIECQPDGAMLCATLIDTILRLLPVNYTAQFVRRNVSNIRRDMMAYAEVESVGRQAEAFAQARMDQFSHAVEHGFIPDSESHNFYPSTEELYLFISTPDFGRLSLESLLSKKDEALNQGVQRFRSIIMAIKDVLMRIGLVFEPLTGSTFVQYVVSFLNPRLLEEGHYLPKILGDELPEAIGKAVVLEGLNDPLGFVSLHGGTQTHFRCVSMIWQPDGVLAGMLDEMVSRERDCAFVTTVRIKDTKEVQMGLKVKRFMMSKMRIGSMNNEEINEMSDDIGIALSRVVNGERFVDARFTVVVTAMNARDVEDRTAAIQTHLTQCGMEYTDVERDIGSSLIINGCLPFPRADYERAFQRSRRMLSADIAELMPVGGAWAGIRRKPYALYTNRTGHPFLFNPMESPRNSNFLIVADSGSGKSFFVNDFLAQTARLPGAIQFVVSVKPDYKKYGKMFGKEVNLSLDHSPSVSPFWGPPTNDSIELWATIVLGMVKTDSSKPATNDVKQIVSAAVRDAAHRVSNTSNGEAEMQLTDIQLQLANGGPLGSQLAHALDEYVDNGRYAKLFTGASGIRPDEHRKIFFNLGGIMATDAGPSVLMCVMRTIDAVMMDERLRGVPKIAIFDEGWSLIANEFGAAFLDRAVRTYRSLGGTVGFITQDPRDLDTPMGRAVLVNTATKIVLPLAKSGASALDNYMDLNNVERGLLQTLNLHKGMFSEFFVQMMGVGSTVARLTPFPLLYSMSTTDPQDESEQFKMLETEPDYTRMIEKFAVRYPRGVEHARASGRSAL